jgi:prolyl-tRNA editing enzyme YbaK/EbsC (Cys-tRNA(Pro) deacylase)
VQTANEVMQLAKSKVNMRMVAEDVSAELTGFGRNAVTPICSATSMPVIMSHKIVELPGLFYLGAGEVDLKVGLKADEFVRGYAEAPVYTVQCTS